MTPGTRSEILNYRTDPFLDPFLGQFSTTNKTVFGVFFEPLADPGVAQPKLEGLSSEQARRASWEFERMKAALKGEKSRDKLRRQVRHFVEFLEKEGVVGAPK